MQNRKWIVAVLIALTVSGASIFAADLENGSGQSCGDFTGIWHFVNNQVPAGSPAGTITADFTSGTFIVGASQINKNTQHFYVEAEGTLLGASTNLGGRLVLSHFTCEDKKDPPKK